MSQILSIKLNFHSYLIYCVVIVWSSFGGLKAQKSTKIAFSALAEHDYFKARKLFYKQLSGKHKGAAAYGLAQIFYRNNNPFHHPDSAAKYAHLSFNYYQQAKKLYPFVYGGITVDSLTIRNLIDSLAFRELIYCSKDASASCFNAWLTKHYLAKNDFIVEAVYNRDELEYRNALEANNSDSVQFFLQTHLGSHFRNEALASLDKQLFKEFTASGTEKGFTDFIHYFPKSRFIPEAFTGLLALHKSKKNKVGIYEFIIDYPAAPQVNDAWKLLFTLSVKNYSSAELDEFLKSYPTFPFRSEILRELSLANIQYIPIQLNELFGFADSTGQIRIKPVYDEVNSFSEGLAVVHKNDSCFYINKDNTPAFPQKFSEAQPFLNGIAPVKTGNSWYFIDRLGDIKNGPFQEINEINEGIYIIKRNNLYGATDAFGKIFLEPRYDKLGDFKNGVAYYQQDNRYGFITFKGYAHKPEFEWLSDFSEYGLAVYKNNNKYGIVNKAGAKITQANFDQALYANSNLYLVIQNNQYGFFSGEKNGCFLTEIIYDYSKDKPEHYYTDGRYLRLIKKGNHALIDLNGKTLIDFNQYQEIGFPKNGLIRVSKKNKHGFIDLKQNIVIALKYLGATDFLNGTAIVESKKGYHIINSLGEELFFHEEEPEQLNTRFFILEAEDKLINLVNLKGKIIAEKIQHIEEYQYYLILYFPNNDIKIIKSSF